VVGRAIEVGQKPDAAGILLAHHRRRRRTVAVGQRGAEKEDITRRGASGSGTSDRLVWGIQQA